MGGQVDKTTLMTAINSREVMENLKKKNVNLTEKSYLVFGDNGSVRVDIDGDGIYDKTINGLVDKKGRVNTTKFDVDTDYTAMKVKNAKFDYEATKRAADKAKQQVKSYETEDGNFDEAKAKENAIKDYEKMIADYMSANFPKGANKNTLIDKKAKAKTLLDALQAKNTDDMTTKQLKAHKEAVDNATAAYNQAASELAKFNTELEKYNKKVDAVEKTKDAYVSKSIEAQKQKYENAQVEAGKQIVKTQEKLAKYNDALEAAGYGSESQRQEYKAQRFKVNPNSEKVSDTQNSLIEGVLNEYIAQNEGLKKRIGGEYTAEIQSNGDAKIYLHDGDKIADITITGFYNPKNGKVSTKGIKWSENIDSTNGRKNAINTFLQAKKAFVDFMTNNPTTDVDSKEAKEMKDKLKQSQQKLKTLKISDEDVKKFQVEA